MWKSEDVIGFLSCPELRWIIGQIIKINDGMT